jgi:LacI family repressor for deo operon, udp, cdd, tsx, nupC, and nupG
MTAAQGGTGGGKSRMVLGLLPGLGNSFWNAIINAIEDVLLRAGYGVVFGDTRGDPVREGHYLRMIESGHVDGLILFNAGPGTAPLARLGLPTVLIYGGAGEADGLATFGVANREAVEAMVGYLVGLGHRRIAHLAGPDQNQDCVERRAAFHDAVHAAGLKADPDLIWPGDHSFVAGAKAAHRFLARGADRPTAIFAATDEMALGCIGALREYGIRVPADVSVTGFDGIEYSAMYEPPLTTMLQPRAELGRLAAAELVRQLGGEAPRPGYTRLPCKLVVRRSAAPPAG